MASEAKINKLYEEAERLSDQMNQYQEKMRLHEIYTPELAPKWWNTYRRVLPAPLSPDEYEETKRHYLCARMEFGRAIRNYFEAKFDTTSDTWTAFANETHQAWVDYIKVKHHKA